MRSTEGKRKRRNTGEDVSKMNLEESVMKRNSEPACKWNNNNIANVKLKKISSVGQPSKNKLESRENAKKNI